MSMPTAGADQRHDLPTACFSVQAAPDPSVMPRVLELFAKRGLVPSRWYGDAGRPGRLTIDIQVDGLDGHATDYLANCMRQIAYVDSVLVSQKARVADAA